jgi:hypothetical protein
MATAKRTRQRQTKITRGNYLTAQLLVFVAEYDGDASAAAIAAGAPPKHAATQGQRMLTHPLVQQALDLKQKAALDAVTKENAKNIKGALKEKGVDFNYLVDKLKTVMESGCHEKRGYADVNKAVEMVAKMIGAIPVGMRLPGPPQGSTGQVEGGVVKNPDGTTFYMYRAAWKDGDDGEFPANSGHTVPAAKTLTGR